MQPRRPVSWIANTRQRLMAGEAMAPATTVRRPRAEMDRAAVEDILAAVHARIAGRAVSPYRMTDGVRAEKAAPWPDEARLDACANGLLVAWLPEDALRLALDLGQGSSIQVVLDRAEELAFEVRARPADVERLVGAIDAALDRHALGRDVCEPFDVTLFGHRGWGRSGLIARELATESGAAIDPMAVRAAMIEVFDLRASRPLPKVPIPSTVKDPRAHIPGLELAGLCTERGSGVVWRESKYGTGLELALDDDSGGYGNVSPPRPSAPFVLTAHAPTSVALASLSDTLVAAFARHGICLEPRLGEVQRMRERIHDLEGREPSGTMRFAWAEDLGREAILEVLLAVHASIRPNTVLERRSGEASEDVTHADGDANGILLYTHAYSTDAKQTDFYVLFPDDTMLTTQFVDECTMPWIDWQIRTDVPQAADAVQRRIEEEMAMRKLARLG